MNTRHTETTPVTENYGNQKDGYFTFISVSSKKYSNVLVYFVSRFKLYLQSIIIIIVRK